MKINGYVFKNIANFIVLVRILFVFAIIALFNSSCLIFRIAGLISLLFIAILDWLDGYLARLLNISSGIGGLLDTLGDRITENLFLIFLAYKQLIPLWVPLIFVARSFGADFIRYLTFYKGIDTFTINKSKLGFYIVASKTSRVIYLLYKIFIFCLGGAILIIENLIEQNRWGNPSFFMILKQSLLYGSIFLVIFNLIRFIFLVYDSRFILKEKFTR